MNVETLCVIHNLASQLNFRELRIPIFYEDIVEVRYHILMLLVLQPTMCPAVLAMNWRKSYIISQMGPIL